MLKDDPYSAIFITDWLSASIKINDRKASVTQHNLLLNIHPFVIRTSVDGHVHHPLDKKDIHRSIPTNLSADSTHVPAIRPELFASAPLTAGFAR